MFSDADHEVIDSPEALFRHLYEEHGVEEARELDPDTAPLQFWLRRHADLERAERAARRPNQPRTLLHRPSRSRRPPRNGPSRSGRPSPAPRRSGPRPRRPRTNRRPGPSQRPRARPAPRARPGRRAQATGGGREGRRPAGFGDPLVEALAQALAGRGHDEVAVRSAIRSFADPGRGPAGEAAVRSVFVEPMLQSVAEHLLGAAPSSPRPAQPPQSAPAATTGPLPSRLPRPGPTRPGPGRPRPPPDEQARSRRPRPRPRRGRTGAARGGMGRALGRPGRHRPAIRRRPRGGRRRRRRRRPDGRGQRRPGPPPGQAATPLTMPAPRRRDRRR